MCEHGNNREEVNGWLECCLQRIGWIHSVLSEKTAENDHQFFPVQSGRQGVHVAIDLKGQENAFIQLSRLHHLEREQVGTGPFFSSDL